MNIKTYIPSQNLYPYVKYFYELQTTVPTDGEMTSLRVIADGCPGLMFHQGDQGTVISEGNILPETFLYGQSTKYANLYVSGDVKVLGICLHPFALRKLFGIKASEITDSCVNLAALGDSEEKYLSERLTEAATTEKQIAILRSFIQDKIDHNDFIIDQRMQYAVQSIENTNGAISLKNLRDELFLTEKSFQRKFKEFMGINPKLFSRICSFQFALTHLKKKPLAKLLDISYIDHYADQSHLIRSFQEFAGISPAQYQKRSSGVLEMTGLFDEKSG